MRFLDFGDYKKVGGVQTPFKIVQTSSEGEVEEYRFKSAKADEKLDPKQFEAPAASK